ncbi:D-lactate ferricytochrome c oxidoreductase [Saxophila tyrrhenica]|uniref:D-lactate dehydrogenase (cytochrome) n=1 Tax=Saxophila tyrrhenica TaxID=1690608 RepID=A0AAV9PKX4_9PEZI|nr:D-lactate ferricytochrome c oxidoreductase [Saxophila tyrrhenica]
MKFCHTRRIPVVAFSGGTSFEGNFANTRRGLCIDFGRMAQVLALHKEDLDVVVQPGVGYEELNERLKEERLLFPPDPGMFCCTERYWLKVEELMMFTHRSWSNDRWYGRNRLLRHKRLPLRHDEELGHLPHYRPHRSTIIKTRQRPSKSSAGYDLSRLFTGAEGTLGLVTEAVLKVTVLPQNERVAVAAFSSIREATQCVSRVVQSGIQVAAVELLDAVSVKCLNESGSTDREWEEAPTLFFRFSETENGVREEIAVVKGLAEGMGNKSFIFAEDEQESTDLWMARKTILWGTAAVEKNDDDKLWATDCALQVSRLSDMIEQTKADLESCGLVHCVIGHVGDGNFHSAIFYSDEEKPIAEAVVHRMVERAIEMEGTVTGEHGAGLVKRDYLPLELGQGTVDAMRRVKNALDPLCLLNCDKVVRMEADR